MTRLVLRLLVCAPLLAAAACGGATPAPARRRRLMRRWSSATNTAIGHMGRYDFQAAVDVLTPLATTYPASAETTFNLAVALINRQRAEDAPEAERRLRAVRRSSGGRHARPLRARACCCSIRAATATRSRC